MLGTIEAMLPPVLRTTLSRLPQETLDALEELRIRQERPLEVVYADRYAFVTPAGGIGSNPQTAYRPSREDCQKLLELLTRHSLYSFEEELRRGYITVAGGHRVGLSGRAVLEAGAVKQIRDVTGFNIRIAREIIDCARQALPCVTDAENRTVHHTLVVSAPQQGKTTFLRDLARLISYGHWQTPGMSGGLKVGIVDERSELAGCERGVPRFDVGPRTDVLDGCPKAEGMMMMIRSLSPHVLMADEIGRTEDAIAIREALHAGIRVIASAHGAGFSDIRQRPALRELIGEGVFGRIVFLRKQRRRVMVERVCGSNGESIRMFMPMPIEKDERA